MTTQATAQKSICKYCGNEINVRGYVQSQAEQLLRDKRCHTCDFWLSKTTEKMRNDPLTARVNGEHYRISDNDFLSMDWTGRTVKFFDGRIVPLKYISGQGTIPERFRHLLSDNAIFEDDKS